MRYLIVSDLHSNREALETVLREAEGRYDTVICCGDLVGYGADPNATVDWARGNVAVIVRGNHDKACCGLSEGEDFNPLARLAALWTRANLTPENLAYLRELPTGPLEIDGFQMVHGSIVDEDEYVFFAEHAAATYQCLDWPVTFFGHTHVQGGFVRLGAGPVRSIQVAFPRVANCASPAGKVAASFSSPAAPSGACSRTFELHEREQYLINPGSVGQPRDGDCRAAFAIYDTDPRPGVIEYCRVSYDVARAQGKIRAAGLPPRLADRLAVGR